MTMTVNTAVSLVDVSRGAALVAATIAMGLFAGLFYAFACAVMPGLARADDRTFVGTMQKINTAIINGWFFVSFIGAGLLTIVAGALHIGEGTLPWIVAGFVLYATAFGVTMRLNVPLNNALDAAGELDRIGDLAQVRARFEGPWVRWNLVRTVASTGALGCLAWALVEFGRSV